MKFAFAVAVAGVAVVSAKPAHDSFNTTKAAERHDVLRRGIYGDDSRVDEADTTDFWREIGRATVMISSSGGITDQGAWGACNVHSVTGNRNNCATLRFGDQIGCGQCSGVLIGPNRVATAGHCVNANSCASKRIIFNATNINVRAGATIPPSTLYSCANVTLSSGNGEDWAIITLDRPVPTSVASPVRVGSAAMPIGTGLMMIGHPDGLARKYAGDATINAANGVGSSLTYTTDVDAFAGNSGSAVFTDGTDANGQCYQPGIMVGFVVSGQNDRDSDGCPQVYALGGILGEGVAVATTIASYAITTVDNPASTIVCPPTPPTAPSPTFRPAEPLGELTCGETVEGDTTGAQTWIGHPSGENFYTLTVATPGTYLFSTCDNSNFDTVIRVYSGSHPSAESSEVATNDDRAGCGSSGVQSRLTTTLAAGDYTVYVEGYQANEGTYSLFTSCSGGPGPTSTAPPASPPTTPEPGAPPTTADPPTSEPNSSQPTSFEPTSSQLTTSERPTSTPTRSPAGSGLSSASSDGSSSADPLLVALIASGTMACLFVVAVGVMVWQRRRRKPILAAPPAVSHSSVYQTPGQRGAAGGATWSSPTFATDVAAVNERPVKPNPNFATTSTRHDSGGAAECSHDTTDLPEYDTVAAAAATVGGFNRSISDLGYSQPQSLDPPGDFEVLALKGSESVYSSRPNVRGTATGAIDDYTLPTLATEAYEAPVAMNPNYSARSEMMAASDATYATITEPTYEAFDTVVNDFVRSGSSVDAVTEA